MDHPFPVEPKTPLTRRDIEARLARERGKLTELRVKSLRLFGSFANDTATDASDIDVLIEFEGPKTFKGYMATKFFLEDLFGRHVDLATEAALRKELREKIVSEAIRVA